MGVFFIVVLLVGLAIFYFARKSTERQREERDLASGIVVKRYRGTKGEVPLRFQADAVKMARDASFHIAILRSRCFPRLWWRLNDRHIRAQAQRGYCRWLTAASAACVPAVARLTARPFWRRCV
jgi:hypothetical protein